MKFEWRQNNKLVCIVIIDNADESKNCKKYAKVSNIQKGMCCKQNHLVKHGFAHLANKGCAVMSNANFPLMVCYAKNAYKP